MLRKQISTTFSEPFLKENDSILDRIRIFQKRGPQTSSFANNCDSLILKKEGIFLIIKCKT